MKTKINFKQSILAGAMAGGIAAIVNTILFFIFHSAGVLVDTIFIQPNQPLTAVPIILSSVLPSLVGSVVFFLIEKFSNNGFKIFRIVAVVLLVLSFMNPFMGIQGVTIGYAMALNLMHVVVAGSLLYFIGKTVKNNA